MSTTMTPEVGTSLQVGERPATVALIRPAASPMALLALHKEIAAVVGSVLVSGTDYGVIPGTGDKPALLKPGAERICFAFGCAPRYEVVSREIEHDREVKWVKRRKKWRNAHRGDREFTWEEESGTSLGLYRYEIRCTLTRREDGAMVAEGLASCSTMESKYIDRPRDTENTVLKMAQKRALIAAVLNGFGLSDRFTQDVDEAAAQPEPTPAPPRLDSAAIAANEAAQAAALAEIEAAMPTLPGKQEEYIREQLQNGADPVVLLAFLLEKGVLTKAAV